jgi:plasmid stabilization system protein ParE
MLEVDFHPEASDELEIAYRWYLRRSPHAASRFVEGVETATRQACEFPERWPKYLHGTRYYRIVRYPFVLVYLREPDRIYAIAVAHLRRRPGYWKNRLP